MKSQMKSDFMPQIKRNDRDAGRERWKKSQFVIQKRINLNLFPHIARAFVYKFMPNMMRKWFCRLGNPVGMVHVLLARHTCLQAK